MGKLLKNKKYNIYIAIAYFILLCIKLLYTRSNGSFRVSESVRMPYIGNYQEFGFASRMFLGSIIFYFTKYISKFLIYGFTVSSAIILYLILSITLKKLLDKYNNKKTMILILYFGFLIHPFGTLFMNVWYGFVDTVCLLMYVIAIIMLNSKNKIISRLSIIFVFFAIATHTMPFFLFGASYFIILLYKYYCQKNDFNYVLKNFLIYILPTIIILFFFQFYKNLNFTSENDMINFILTKTDVEYWEEFIHYEYFDTIIANCIKSYRGVSLFAGISSFFSCLLYLPLFIFFEMFWHHCKKNTNDTNLKLVFLSCFLSFIPTIICFIGSDFLRWFESYFFVNFIILINFLLHNEYIVSNKIFSYNYNISKKKKLYTIISLLLLITNIGPYCSYIVNGFIYRIVASTFNFIEWWNINIYW